MNERNLKHGFSGSSTYYCWQNLKRSHGGICLSWRSVSNFIVDIGPRPSSAYWLFRSRPYQRSRKGNVEWRIYKRQFRDIWQYMTTDELLACQQHIEVLCARGGYDFDAGMNELYLQDLKGIRNPVARIHSWIKRYLPKILADLKKQRGEVYRQTNGKT